MLANHCIQYTIAFLPEVRLSYLNRAHVTLYLALSEGFAQFFGTEEQQYNTSY